MCSSAADSAGAYLIGSATDPVELIGAISGLPEPCSAADAAGAQLFGRNSAGAVGALLFAPLLTPSFSGGEGGGCRSLSGVPLKRVVGAEVGGPLEQYR